MSATAYDALMSEINPLIEEGYTIVISRGKNWIGYDGLVYKVIVMDGEIVVTQAENGILSEAMTEVYSSTPERDKVNE